MVKPRLKVKIEIPESPNFNYERELVLRGFQRIAGVDEVGRGAWAGPLVAAAVVLPLPDGEASLVSWKEAGLRLEGVRDSKQVPPDKRERLYDLITGQAEIGFGIISSLAVDLIGVGEANRLAMARAVKALPQPPHFLLLDAFRVPQIALPQMPLIKGDARSLSIAAASIVAKVTRDRLMRDFETIHPGYDFSRNKGYGTAIHSSIIKVLGPCEIHRFSYTPVWEAFVKKE